MKTQTQRQLILKALKKWIIAAECYKLSGSLNLTTRVSGYRSEGMTILDKWNPSHEYKLYKLVK